MTVESSLDVDSIIDEIQVALDELPTRKFQRSNSSRRGAQRLAFACVYEVAKANGLFADPEFETRYVDREGRNRRGFIDVVIEEPNHFKGLLLACEIVVDKVKFKDLLKLRDAAMSDSGKRLIIQLDPYEKFPVTASKALSEELTDEMASEILIMRYRRGRRTLIDRRNGARWAVEQRRADAERAKSI